LVKQKSKVSSEIEIRAKNRNFWQKSKFRGKIEILWKNRNFVEKSKFCGKIEILIKNQIFSHKPKSCIFCVNHLNFFVNHRNLWSIIDALNTNFRYLFFNENSYFRLLVVFDFYPFLVPKLRNKKIN